MTFEADLIRVDATAALTAAHLSPADCRDLIADVFAGKPPRPRRPAYRPVPRPAADGAPGAGRGLPASTLLGRFQSWSL